MLDIYLLYWEISYCFMSEASEKTDGKILERLNKKVNISWVINLIEMASHIKTSIHISRLFFVISKKLDHNCQYLFIRRNCWQRWNKHITFPTADFQLWRPQAVKVSAFKKINITLKCTKCGEANKVRLVLSEAAWLPAVSLCYVKAS